MTNYELLNAAVPNEAILQHHLDVISTPEFKEKIRKQFYDLITFGEIIIPINNKTI